MTYYNERNGWVDTGKRLNNRKCPNCKSTKFKETLSREYCPDCGLECDYWGSGANDVYNAYSQRYHANLEKMRREQYNREHGYRPGDYEYWEDDYD